MQYYPRVDSVSPAVGSLEGGTVVTVAGGGFAMDLRDASVSVRGRPCRVTASSIEAIVCNTTAFDNATAVQTKVAPNPYPDLIHPSP